METEARPGPTLTITVLGAIAGLCLALLLQQAGVLPLDRLAAFGLPALVGGVVLLVVTMRTGFARSVTEIIAIITVLVLVIVTVTGIPALAADGEVGDASGYLTGPCTASASSEIDAMRGVGTMSRSNPFVVDPDGSVTWDADSSGPITDHGWEIWVDAGGFPITIDSGGDDNAGLSTTNDGSRQVRPYVDDVASAIGGDVAGIYLVGGFIDGDGGRCDGQAWVRVSGSVLSNYVGQGSLAVLITVITIITILLVKVSREVAAHVAKDGLAAVGDDGGFPPGAMQ